MTAPRTSSNTAAGTVVLSERAVAKIVAAAAASVPGTTSLSRGLERIAGRSYPRYDVMIDDHAGSTTIEAFIAVSWPAPVTAVAEQVRSTIARWVTTMTGLRVEQVNVVVGPVVAGSQRVSREALAAAPTAPQVTPVNVTPSTVRSPAPRAQGPTGAEGLRRTSDDLTPITVAKPAPAVPVRTGEEPADVPISTKPGPAEVPIHVPDPQPLRSIPEPQEPPSVAIRTPRETPLARVTTPKQWRLAPVTVRPLHPASPSNQKGERHGRVH